MQTTIEREEKQIDGVWFDGPELDFLDEVEADLGAALEWWRDLDSKTRRDTIREYIGKEDAVFLCVDAIKDWCECSIAESEEFSTRHHHWYR